MSEYLWGLIGRLNHDISNVEPEEKVKECEKCGTETSTKIIGDESYDSCPTCGWITH